MKHLALLSVLFVPILATPAAAAGSGVPPPDRAANNVQMIYAVNPVAECFRTARDAVDLSLGLEHCNIAMRDPLLNHRAETIVNRGIIRFDLGDHDGALHDFDRALEINPAFGNAYLNQAQVLVAEKRPDEAMAAINQGIALGATNLQVAYYTRGEIEDDAGHYAKAYRDYEKALTIKPDYAPAMRQIARFKIVPRSVTTTQ